MRRIAAWAMSTLSVIVLLFSYTTSRSSQVVSSTLKSQSSSSSSTSSSSSEAAASGDAAQAHDGSAQTYAGDEVMTRYGVVQVRITVENGKITKSEVLQVPWTDRHDQMINSQAVPLYNEEAVAAQSAQIDVVSGATVTWQGYTQSLQSAIDRAHL